jgi:hypothetical protein
MSTAIFAIVLIIPPSDALVVAVNRRIEAFLLATAIALEGSISTTLRNSITTALTKVSMYTT